MILNTGTEGLPVPDNVENELCGLRAEIRVPVTVLERSGTIVP